MASSARLAVHLLPNQELTHQRGEHQSSKDRRRTQLALTADGHALIAAVSPNSRAIYGAIEARFGCQRITVLLDALVLAADVTMP